MNPFRKVIIPTSLGNMQASIVTIPAGSGTRLQFRYEQNDVREGSIFGSADYPAESQTFAPLTSQFYIHGKSRDYLVKPGTGTSKQYSLYGGPTTAFPLVGVIGVSASGYFSFTEFRYCTDNDAWTADYSSMYIANATSNPPLYDLSQTQTDGTGFGYALVTWQRQGNVITLLATATHDSVPDITIRDILGNARIPGGGSDPYDDLDTPGDDPIPGGGTVGIPGMPGLTATSAGVIGLFAPSAAQMQLLADFMWTDFGGTATDVFEVLQEILEALKRSISNPLDYIIGLNIIPSQGLSIGSSKVVRFGFVSSGVSMPQLANQYFTVDCGSLSFDTLCGDTFLDYAPYSKFSIYLPYIGFKDVDPNDFVGHTIGVIYHGDVVTGGVTAYITKDGSVMYQYSGCCALNVPLSADNWGETISAAINVATGIVAAAATGGAAGVAAAAAKGAANVAANPSLLSPQVSHSGAVSGGAGCMGVQYPFVIREAVNFHSTEGFNKSAGYPAYYYRQLADVTGFTTVIDAHMSGIPMATQDEIQEIESLLERGVIL